MTGDFGMDILRQSTVETERSDLCSTVSSLTNPLPVSSIPSLESRSAAGEYGEAVDAVAVSYKAMVPQFAAKILETNATAINSTCISQPDCEMTESMKRDGDLSVDVSTTLAKDKICTGSDSGVAACGDGRGSVK